MKTVTHVGAVDKPPLELQQAIVDHCIGQVLEYVEYRNRDGSLYLAFENGAAMVVELHRNETTGEYTVQMVSPEVH